MIIYLLRRFVLLIFTLFILSLIGFSLIYFTPNAPLQGVSLKDALTFWFNRILIFDFGISSINGQSINEQLREVFPATLELCIMAFCLALVIGVPLGILAGVMRNRWQDKMISIFVLVGFSMPIFWLALLLVMFFSLELGWLPVGGRVDLLYQFKTVTGFALIDAWLSDSPWRKDIRISVIIHAVLPVVTLAMLPATEMIRLIRLGTSEVMDTNYIKAAAIRGLNTFTLVHRHVLHNALPLVISRIGSQFAGMLTLAMITEVVFNWPGMGRWLINAIRQQDYNVISAGVMVIGGLVITINMLSNLLGAMVDPLKHKEGYVLR